MNQNKSQLLDQPDLNRNSNININDTSNIIERAENVIDNSIVKYVFEDGLKIPTDDLQFLSKLDIDKKLGLAEYLMKSLGGFMLEKEPINESNNIPDFGGMSFYQMNESPYTKTWNLTSEKISVLFKIFESFNSLQYFFFFF